jgi:hypothetical protein
MGFQLSPGVAIAEIDLSTVVTGVATTGGVIAGPLQWGPANVRTLVDSEITLVNTFGKPTNDTAEVFMTAASFLQYGNNLNVVRVLSANARNAAVLNDGVAHVVITTSGAGYTHVPTLAFSSGAATATCTVLNGGINSVTITATGSGYSITVPPTITITPTSGDIITTPAVLTAVVGVQIKNQDDYEQNFAAGQAMAGDFVAKYAGALGNGIQVAICDDASQFPTWPYKGLFTSAPGTSDYAAANGGTNDELHIVVIDNVGIISGTPGDILETYAFASKAADAKDAQGESIYYPTVIDRKSSWIRWLDFPAAGTNWGQNAHNVTFTQLTPSATKASKDLLVANAGITYTAVASGSGGNSITVAYVQQAGTTHPLTVSVVGNVITVNLQVVASVIASIATSVKAAVDAVASGLVTTALDGTGADLVTAFGPTALAGGYDATTYLVILEGGADANTYGSTVGTVTDGIIMEGYDLFNVDEFDFALILTANHSSTVAIHCINDISESRMDSVTFLSPPKDAVVNNAGNEVTDVVAYRNTLPSSSYAFLDSNWIKKYDKYNDLYRWVPANGDVAGLCVRTDFTRDPWFSPAGLNRGNIKGVTSLAWNPKQAYRDVLYQSGVNPIVAFPGQGAVLFGDKTLQSKPSAFDRINVRRLFIVIEKAISRAAKYTLFEFNDEVTRAQFRGLIDPFLRDIQGRRGLYNYKVVCDASNNTPQMIDTNSFQGDIYLQPAKSINFIKLNFIATRTGVSFDEIVGKF